MKHLYNISLFLILIGISSCTSSRYYQGNPDDNDQTYSQQQQQTYSQQQPQQITYQQFYNDLSPYGNWVNYGGYGYVWIPSQPGFRPYYTNGHWVYTNYGWTWASDYNWGWAPFHYGRWMQDMSYGWMWVPGYEWAPAWVSWRGGSDYYGWAPLGPGMNADISVGSIPYNDWAFVPSRYISSARLNNYYVNPSRNVTIINNTTIINNNTVVNNGRGTRSAYNPGPPVREVEQTTGNRIRQYNLAEASKPGAPQVSNNTLRVYRPVVNQSATNSSNARPQRVITPDQSRTPQNNVPNRNDVNNQQSAPVRQFPKEQTPQINRNEPPVNMPQRVIPNNQNTPRRVSPEYQQQQNQIQQNPVNRNTEPQNSPTENTPPRRVFRETQSEPANRNAAPENNISREPVRKDQQLNPEQNNNPAPTAPVRRFSNTTPVNNPQTNQIRRAEEPTRQMVRQNSEINVANPAPAVGELKPVRREE
jgi:hypothetical protein